MSTLGFTQGKLWVCSSKLGVNPEQTTKVNPGLIWGLLSVRLGIVGTVYIHLEKYLMVL